MDRFEQNVRDAEQYDTWAARSFASVTDRGFHDDDAIPALCKDERLATQFVRLSEEVIEWGLSLRAEESLRELADVCIVAANMGWLLGIDLSKALHGELPCMQLEITDALGMVARAMRSQDAHSAPIIPALVTLITACGKNARAYHGGSQVLQDAILRKLQADEKRGRLHRGV